MAGREGRMVVSKNDLSTLIYTPEIPNILRTRIVETRFVNYRILEKKESAIYEGNSETLKLHISSLLEKYLVGY